MVATIAALFRYPVKGLRGHALQAADIERRGIAGDRRWLVVDDTDRFITQRECPLMARIEVRPVESGLILSTGGRPDLMVPFPASDAEPAEVVVWRSTVVAARAADEAGAWLEALLGRPSRLVFMANPKARPVDPNYGLEDDWVSFADGFPVLLTSVSSLDDLNGRLALPVQIHRFRPNIVITGAEAWAEDTWRRIRVGDIAFRLPKPSARCSVTSVDQQTGERPEPHEPLHTLGTFRRREGGIIFGQNLIPDTLGRIAVGDVVTVLEASDPSPPVLTL